MANVTISNREYQSSAFSLLFRKPIYALELYNCLNGTSYDDPDEVEIYILENGITLSVRNDASFIIDSVLSLAEHQATYSPNMPLRQLIYVAGLYRNLTRKKALFSRRRLMLPRPRFVVFYTGTENRPAYELMRLSDAYESGKAECVQSSHPDLRETDAQVSAIRTQPAPSYLELTCEVYNLNTAENRKKFENTTSISGFLAFIDRVKDNLEHGEDRRAVEEAVDYCIRRGILTEFFRENRMEIINATTWDLTYERQLELEREEARAELEEEKAKAIQTGMQKGLLEGRQKGRQEGLQQGLQQGLQEGLASGKTEAILDILSDYGTVSDELRESISAIRDADTLKKLLRLAAKVHSVEEFLDAMDTDQ